jgi:ABC-type antimicrobial peptide transport system permease subunit
MVLREAAILVASGVAIGLAGATLGNRVVRTMVYETSLAQSPLLIAASLVLVITAALAAIIPARRATSVDPMQALRSE